MKRTIKIFAWIAGSFLLLIVLAIAGLTLFFPKDKAKTMAIEKISSTLGRKVTIDGISLSFWSGFGIYLEGIRIYNPQGFEGPDILSAKALDVKLRIMPLFKKEIQLDRIILEKPQISLHKLSDGRNNYKFGDSPDITNQRNVAPAPSAEEELSDETKMAALAISFENLKIENGVLRYLDDSSGFQIFAREIGLRSRMDMPKQMNYHITGVLAIDSLKISSVKSKIPPITISAEYDATIDLNDNSLVLSNSKLKINGLEFDIKAGIPNLKTMAFVNLEVETNGTKIKDALPLLPDMIKTKIAPYKIDGIIGFDAAVKYNKSQKQNLTYSGKALLTDLKLSKSDIKGELLINSARVDFKNNYLRFAIDKGSFDNNPLEGVVAISNFSNPEIDGKFKGILNLSLLNPFLPKKGNPQISGIMQFDIGATGSIKNLSTLQMNGSLSIKDGAYHATTLPEPIEKFNTDIKISPKNMDINNLYVKFPSSDFSLTGKMTNPFPGLIPGYKGEASKPFLTFKLNSRRLDADKLFPEAVPGSGINRAEMPLDSIPPLILPDINGNGTSAIDTLIYSKVEFTKITGSIAIKDRKIYVTEANGNVYTGRVTGETEIDLNNFDNPKYTGKFEATQVEANDFLTRFAGFSGHLFGKLNMDGNFSATGWEPEPMLKSLTMDGLAAFNEAKLVNFDLLEQLAQNLNFKTFDEETLKDAATIFKVINGRVAFDGLKFASNLGDWNVAGSIGFDGSIDYLGEVLLSDKVTDQLMSQSGMVSSLAGLFKESNTGRVKVPFRLGGSYKNPKVSLDMSAKNRLKDDLKGKLDSALQNLLKKK